MKKKNEPTPKQGSKKAPVHTAKAGPVQASVFVNQTNDGKEFPSVVITRRYKGKDGNWQSSDSYGAKHLANLAELLVSVGRFLELNDPYAAQ